MPLDVDALTALRDLTSPRADERRPLPAVGSLTALADLVAVDLPRRRVVALALLAAAAGLVCGLLAPGASALAAPLTSALSGTLHPSLPDRPDPRAVPAAARPLDGADGAVDAVDTVDDAATPDPTEGPRAQEAPVSAVDAVTRVLRSGLGSGG